VNNISCVDLRSVYASMCRRVDLSDHGVMICHILDACANPYGWRVRVYSLLWLSLLL